MTPPRRLVLLTVPLLLAAALAGCAGGEDGLADGDGDGIPDRSERQERPVSVTLREGAQTRRVTSDPEVRDTDGDGLPDGDEFHRGTDPRSADTDLDGLLDGFNVTLDEGDARAQAWRALGVRESPTGTFVGELSLCRHVGALKPTEWTSDRPVTDRLGDGDELLPWSVRVRGETREVLPDPCAADADGDLLPDHLERERATDPRAADTDDDGHPDGTDLDPLWDLRLRLHDVVMEGANASVRLHALDAEAVLAPGEPGALVADVDEQVPVQHPRDAFEVQVLLTALDAETGEPVRLFPGGAQAILAFDLVRGTSTPAGEGGTLRFAGEDGSVSFAWTVEKA